MNAEHPLRSVSGRSVVVASSWRGPRGRRRLGARPRAPSSGPPALPRARRRRPPAARARGSRPSRRGLFGSSSWSSGGWDWRRLSGQSASSATFLERRSRPRPIEQALSLTVWPRPRASLGIERIEGLHYYVHDLERTRRFFVDKLDFVEIGHERPRAGTRGATALGRVPGRRRAVRHPSADRRGRARLALPAQAPRGGRHGRVRRRGHRPRVRAARRARRHVHHRRAALLGRRAARWRCSRSRRRSATRPSASSSGGATRGSSRASSRGAGRRRAPATASASSASTT